MDPVRIALLLSFALVLGACGSDGAPADVATATTAPPAVEVSEEPTEVAPPESESESHPAPCQAESRKSYEGRPIISVTQPCAGDALKSPATVAGEANVFEATVSMRILDENGAEIGTAFTTAECGTGCWGAFEGTIEFEVMREQTGTLQVFESSAEDGSDLHKVSIEVTLLP